METAILKRNIPVHDQYFSDSSVESIFYGMSDYRVDRLMAKKACLLDSSILTIKGINGIKCTTFINKPFIDMEHIESLHKYLAAEEDEDEATSVKLENTEDISLGKERVTHNSRAIDRLNRIRAKLNNGKVAIESEDIWFIESLENDAMGMLIVPEGMDLSNSFKAKYI